MHPLEVEAYAGASYPERPLRVRWRGGWRRVIAVRGERREPRRRCFDVFLEGAEGDIGLRLCYDYANDAWSAEPLDGRAEEGEQG